MIEFREITRTSSNEFHEVMEMYVRAFPSRERHPVSVIAERVRLKSNRLYVGSSGNETVFFALLWPLRDTDFVLLDYIATKHTYRNKGIASTFLRTMADELKVKGKHIILEVESPRSGDNRQERERRVAFYRHHGAKELQGINYMLPPLDGNTPTKMILMMLPECEEGKISGDVVRKTIVQMYRELYGRNENDALLGTFVQNIGDTVELI